MLMPPLSSASRQVRSFLERLEARGAFVADAVGRDIQLPQTRQRRCEARCAVSANVCGCY